MQIPSIRQIADVGDQFVTFVPNGETHTVSLRDKPWRGCHSVSSTCRPRRLDNVQLIGRPHATTHELSNPNAELYSTSKFGFTKGREQALLFLRKAAQDESLLDAVLGRDSVSD